MPEQRTNAHTVSRLTAHIVWSTKYRLPVLNGDIQINSLFSNRNIGEGTFGEYAMGAGVLNITDEMVNEYLEHHRRPDDGEGSNFIIEK